MKGLKQFGAMALAAALTVTLVAPISARADYEDQNYDMQETTFYDYDEHGTYDAEGDFNRTGYTYKNKVTGDTYTYNRGDKWDSDAYRKATKSFFGNPKKVQVGVKNNLKFSLKAESGQAFDGKLKIKSGKANVTVKQVGKIETEVLPTWDSNAKQYYFAKLDGTKEYVGDLDDAQWYAKKRIQYQYTYILYGKQAGAAKLQYKIDGKKNTIKVTVTDNARPFASVTFGGKSYQLDYNAGATNSNYYAKQSSNKVGNFYTTKKSGKFKLQMNKNYKFTAMYVVKDTDYETVKNTNWDEGTKLARKSTKGIDLNGDGDFEDRIDGISESEFKDKFFVKYTKKNAKIKLNTSFDQLNENGTDYYDENKQYSRKYTHTYKGNTASTRVIVVYQNKITKAFGTQEFKIEYKKNKKK